MDKVTHHRSVFGPKSSKTTALFAFITKATRKHTKSVWRCNAPEVPTGQVEIRQESVWVSRVVETRKTSNKQIQTDDSCPMVLTHKCITFTEPARHFLCSDPELHGDCSYLKLLVCSLLCSHLHTCRFRHLSNSSEVFTLADRQRDLWNEEGYPWPCIFRLPMSLQGQ